MAEELDPCLHLSVYRDHAGWFCQGCGEQFAPAADIRRVDDINERFTANERVGYQKCEGLGGVLSGGVVAMREVENAQRAVPRMDREMSEIPPDWARIRSLETRAGAFSDAIALLDKVLAETKKTVSDLDKRVGSEYSPPDISHSGMISNLTQAVMRLEKQAGISQ